MKNSENYLKNNLLFILLALQPFLDILAFFQQDMSVSIAGYFRLSITFAIPLYTLCMTKKRKPFIISMSVIAAFLALHVLNGFRVGYTDIFADVKYMLLVSHAIVLLYSFMFLYEKESLVKQIKKGLLVVIPSIAVMFYLSYFLKSGAFTYSHCYVGWTGWNVTPSVFSIILSAIFPFIVYFCINDSKKWLMVLLIPLSYIYILNGTKATYLTLVFTTCACAMFLVAEYFIKKGRKFPLIAVLFLICISVSSLMFYKYSPRAQIDHLNNANIQAGENLLSNNKGDKNNPDKDPDDTSDSSQNDKDPTNDEHIKDVFEQSLDPNMVKRFGRDRYLAAYEGRMTAETLADNRLKKIIFGSLVWDETDSITKFVGFEESLMVIGDETYDLETDPHAILFYYGYIGALLYAGLIIYFWLRLLKQLIFHFKDSINLFNFVLFVNYGLLMLSTFYTGHLLRRPNSAIYLAIVLLLIYCQTEPLFKKQIDRKG